MSEKKKKTKKDNAELTMEMKINNHKKLLSIGRREQIGYEGRKHCPAVLSCWPLQGLLDS